jgi:hypothetical protein
MDTGAISIPKGVLGANISDLLKLVGMPSEREREVSAAKISASANELFRTVLSIIDDLLLGAIEKRTAEDFSMTRAEAFPQYFAAMRALGDLIKIVVPRATIERMVSESFCELEADFRDLGPSTVGSELSERGMFTIWTLRKINDLAEEIEALPSKDMETDANLASKFATYAVWTRFHTDCLLKAMRSNRPIYPEVVEPIRDGLRAAVDAYGWIRQWVDLRSARPEPEVLPIPWDGEDDCLLADSMRDMAREPAS